MQTDCYCNRTSKISAVWDTQKPSQALLTMEELHMCISGPKHSVWWVATSLGTAALGAVMARSRHPSRTWARKAPQCLALQRARSITNFCERACGTSISLPPVWCFGADMAEPTILNSALGSNTFHPRRNARISLPVSSRRMLAHTECCQGLGVVSLTLLLSRCGSRWKTEKAN